MRIAILGSGNVANVLARAFRRSNHQISQVYSRNIPQGSALAEECDCPFISDPSKVRPISDFYLLAVSDSAIGQVAAGLSLGDRLIAHTAGSIPSEVLAASSNRFGCFYPLQSLNKERASIPPIPILVEGNTTLTLKELEALAKTISTDVHFADGAKRRQIHLAAVVANNLTNQLFRLTQEFCGKEEIPFEWLLPLLEETVNRLHFGDAQKWQTGPASRGDQKTMEIHQEMLDQYPELGKIYRILSQQILGRKGHG